MRIKVLGTRGEIDESAPYHARHTGLLFDGALLVDLGEPEFLAYRPKAVLLTHLHPDHAYFVRPRADLPPDGVPIFGPEPCPQAKIRPFGRAATIAGLRVRPVPVHHSLRVRSQAYLVSRAGRTVLCTGDMLWIDKAYHPLFAGVDLVITEASAMRAGGFVRRDKATGRVFGHRSVPDLVRFFAPFCRRIVLIHFGSWFFADAREARRMTQALGRKYGVSVEAAHDGQELVV
jgi:glyoxylase-like metal-dependent hydrolase (beta-lactamase superfamily II)